MIEFPNGQKAKTYWRKRARCVAAVPAGQCTAEARWCFTFGPRGGRVKPVCRTHANKGERAGGMEFVELAVEWKDKP